MLFLQVFIRISIQFGGFSEQHQGNQRTKSLQNFAGFRGFSEQHQGNQRTKSLQNFAGFRGQNLKFCGYSRYNMT